MIDRTTSNHLKKIIWAVALLLISALSCNFPGMSNDSVDLADVTDDATLAIPGPMVAFQEPAPGLQIDLNESFNVSVTATDVLGVVRLDLWVDDVVVLSQPAPETSENGINPLILNYGMIGTQPGTYSLVARAYNRAGALGESMALHVTVSSAQAADKEPDQVHYIAQDGDTLDSIAKDTGSTVAAIQAANPGVSNPPNPGQHVAVPGAQANQPPAKPAQPPANQPGQQPGQAGQQPGNQQAGQVGQVAGAIPGILPVHAADLGQQLPAAQPIAPGLDGQIAHLAPKLFPGFVAIQNGTNPELKAPDGLTISTADCKVTVNWKDNSSNETGFAIYRRLKPDQVASQYVASVSANQTSYVDEVPYPGTYEYTVEALGKINVMPPDQIAANVIQQNMISTSRSAPVYILVKPTTACIEDPDRVKYIHVQPRSVEAKRGSGSAALWYSVNDSPGQRAPGNQGQYSPMGQWSVSDGVIPVAGSFFLNPDQLIMAKFWAAAYDKQSWHSSSGPADLGEALNAHIPADIVGKTDNFYRAENDKFKVEYKIWLEELKWTGKGTTTKIPAPINLTLFGTYDTYRQIQWDWQGDKNLIDGYILYRSYSCPGMDTQVYAPQMIPKSKKEATIPLKSEPMGCAYRYQVSAYGRVGESALSNALTGDTEEAFAIAGITLKELKINAMPNGPGGVQLKIYVNHLRRLSDVYWVKPASYALHAWTLDGRRPHNALALSLTEQETISISFSVSGVDPQGYVAQDSVCKGTATIPPVAGWQNSNSTQTIKSSRGDCELVLDLTGQKPQATSSGGVLHRSADITVTKVARIGNKVFAYFENNGPDQLYNNRLGYSVSWFKMLPNGNTQVTGHRYDHTLWVQSSLPQWVYLDSALDTFIRQECKGKISDCEYMLYVPQWAEGYYDDPKQPDFTDPDPKNDDYYDKFETIGIVK